MESPTKKLELPVPVGSPDKIITGASRRRNSGLMEMENRLTLKERIEMDDKKLRGTFANHIVESKRRSFLLRLLVGLTLLFGSGLVLFAYFDNGPTASVLQQTGRSLLSSASATVKDAFPSTSSSPLRRLSSLSSTDTSGWKSLYASLKMDVWLLAPPVKNANNFLTCPDGTNSFAENPCECTLRRNGLLVAQVKCTEDAAYITSIVLQNFEWNTPGTATILSTSIQLLSFLTEIEITPGAASLKLNGDGSWKSSLNSGLCIKYIPRCDHQLAKCTFANVQPCAATGLGAWGALQSSTAASQWTKCAATSNPCACNAGVTCLFDNKNVPYGIQAISLSNNNLKGFVPSRELSVGLSNTLQTLDLSNNPMLKAADFGQFACVHLQKCDQAEWQCYLPEGVQLCASQSDLGAWWILFDSVKGLPAGCTRSDPCRTCGASIVTCKGNRITSLDLSSVSPVKPLTSSTFLLRLSAIESKLVLPLTQAFEITQQEGVNCLVPPPRCLLNGTNLDCRGKSLCPPDSTTTTEGQANSTVDLAKWIFLYDSLGGAKWTLCANARNDPCTLCAGVKCRLGDGAITKIALPNNNLDGTLLDNTLPSFPQLQYVDFSGNPKLKFQFSSSDNGEPYCYTLEYCRKPNVICDFGTIPLCDDRSKSPTILATASPTTIALSSEDLSAWQYLYDALSGTTWWKCADKRNDPCACTDKFKGVTCAVIDYKIRIVKIDLDSNKMRGVLTPEMFRNFAMLTAIDLFNVPGAKNANKFSLPAGEACLDLQPECASEILCNFKLTGVQLCPTKPTPRPVQTRKPTIPARTVSPTVERLDCITDGGWAPPESMCAQNYFVNGKGPFLNCLPMESTDVSLLPFMGSSYVDVPYEPHLFKDKSMWCPTVKNYKSTNGREWGYCQCTSSKPVEPSMSPTPGTTIDEGGGGSIAPTVAFLDASDLAGWKIFYDEMGGQDWFTCSDRNFPCIAKNCAAKSRRVECENIDGKLHITTIVLRNNNLNGVLPPLAFNRMKHLGRLDLSNDRKNKVNKNFLFVPPGITCLNINLCVTGNCFFGYAGVDISTLRYCPTKAPTPGPINKDDLATWKQFWEALSGTQWESCNSYDDPCSLKDCNPRAEVECEVDQFTGENRIVKIVFQNQALNGVLPDLSKLTALRMLDLRNPEPKNGKTKNRITGCINNPVCPSKQYCLFGGTGLTVCPATPTLSPTMQKTYVLDREAFANFRMNLNQPGWKECSQAVDPCADCPSRIKCVLSEPGPTLRVTSMNFKNNNLVGQLPKWKQVSNDTGFSKLRVLDLSFNPKLSHGDFCVDYFPLPCGLPSSSCTLAQSGNVTFCPVTNVDDQSIWSFFYDALQGAMWRRCSESRDKACSCVPCDASGRITQISLPDNKMTGGFPANEISLLPKLVKLNVSTSNVLGANRNLFTNSGCVKLDFCNNSIARCDFTRSGVNFCPPAATSSPTSKQSVYPPIRVSDSITWRALYNAMNGPEWVKCSKASMNPCEIDLPSAQDCAQVVECGVVQGRSVLVALKLKRNGLTGFLPDRALGSLLALEFMDFSNTGTGGKLNSFTNNVCIDIQRCYQDIECRFDGALLENISLCTFIEESTFSPTPLLITTGSPTIKSDVMTHPDDLSAFLNFFEATKGMDWITCKTAYLDPCNKDRNGCDPLQIASKRIICDKPSGGDGKWRIVEIKLVNNALRGYLPNMSGFANLYWLDLSNNALATAFTANIFFNTECTLLPKCYDGMYCSLQNTGHPGICPSFSLSPTFSTSSPTLLPTQNVASLRPSDLIAWGDFYDTLNGPKWKVCSQFRNNPCANSCGLGREEQKMQRITCLPINGELRITEIKLPNNAMTGYVPVPPLLALTELTYLELDSTTPDPALMNIFYNTRCVDLSRCYDSQMYCSLKGASVQFCLKPAETSPPTRFPTQAVITASPTKAPSFPPGSLAIQDLNIWRQFYDALRGSAWKGCVQSREDPCGGCFSGLDKYVSCALDGSNRMRIKEIVLRSNRLRGTLPNIQNLTSLTYLDLRNIVSIGGSSVDDNVFLNTGCYRAPFCASSSSVACLFDGTSISLCV